MCGAIPTPCETCGTFYRIGKLCDCEGDENDSN